MDDEFYHAYYAANLLIFVIVLCISAFWLTFGPRFKWRRQIHLDNPVRLGVTLSLLSLGMALFIMTFGNRQFGGFDHSIMLDVGWRLYSGQKPYVDFPCTMPPGFMLGSKLAFFLFGDYWNSQLYLTSLFAVATFLWSYILFEQLLSSRFMALASALCIQAITNLLLCFWWYNTTASVSGTLFFLSALLLYLKPKFWGSQLSFAVSLILLSLMKPNTAAPLIVGATFVLVSTRRCRANVILLTAFALLAAYGVLAANSIDLSGLLESYRIGGQSRGPGSVLKLQFYLSRKSVLLMSAGYLAAMLIPFSRWFPSVFTSIRQKDWTTARLFLLLALAPVVSVLAMLTNGEIKFVDMALILAADAILLWGNRAFHPAPVRDAEPIRTLYAIVLATVASVSLYMGASRFRVALIGNYFQEPAVHTTANRFFSRLRTGVGFVGVLQNVEDLLRTHPTKPIFFGPRMEYCYAAFDLPSPKHLPVWWDPGAAFARSQEPALISEWRRQSFQTLIFFKHEFIYYSPGFKALIYQLYSADDSYPYLTVFRLKSGTT